MGVLLGRRTPEERNAGFYAPITPVDDGSYSTVQAATGLTAMQSVAVRTSVDLIASLCSELPVNIHRGRGPGRRSIPMPEHLQDPGGDGYGLEDWGYRVVESWLLRGNMYGEELDRSPQGYTTQIEVFHPDYVNGWIEDGQVRWHVNGRRFERPDRFIHKRVNPVPGMVLGLSPISMHAVQIGLSLTSTRYGYQWFRDDAHPGSMLKNSEKSLTNKQVQRAKQWFMAAFTGTREPAVMGRGWDYQKIQIAPEESQFLQTQGFTEAQCARIFGPGIPETLGYESGGSLTYSNVESRFAHLLVGSLSKWFRRYERLLTTMLPRSQYALIDRDALLQSTTLERFRAHESALRNRWKVVNEVREVENLEPVDWGNEPNGGTGGGSGAGGQAEADDNTPTGAEAPAPPTRSGR